jgi:replication factor A1
MDYSEVAARISHKINAKGQNVDSARVEAKLRRLVEEFGVPPGEAERAVLQDLSREFGIQGLTAGSGEQKTLADVMPGDWVTIEGKVVALTSPQSPAIAQSGIIADDSGAMRFVVWAKAQAARFTLGNWYRLESAVGDEFRGVPSLKIHSGTVVHEIEHDGALIPMVIPVTDLHPGVGSVRAKVLQEWDVTHDRMLQSGLLADSTGTVKFVIWKEEGRERLVPNAVYTIYYAMVALAESRDCHRGPGGRGYRGRYGRGPGYRGLCPSCTWFGADQTVPGGGVRPGPLPAELLPDP